MRPNIPSAAKQTRTERALKRLFWRYILVGYAFGVVIAAGLLLLILAGSPNLGADMPAIYVLTAFAHIGAAGGLIGAGLFMSNMKADGDT